MAPLRYPPAPRSDAVDNHFGEQVADPYRALEDPDDPATVAWVDAESALTETVLATGSDRACHAPPDHRVMGPSEIRGAVRARRQVVPDPQPRLAGPAGARCGRAIRRARAALLDPNLLSAGRDRGPDRAEVESTWRLVAYATSEAGSDWMTWHVRDARDRADLRDLIEWSKFSGAAWLSDGAGFYYSGLDQPAAGRRASRREPWAAQVLFHRVGDAAGRRPSCSPSPDQPDWLPRADVSDDGRYLIITINRGTAPENDLLVTDLEGGGLELIGITVGFEAKSVVRSQ